MFTKGLAAGIGAGASAGRSQDGCHETVAAGALLTGADAGAVAGLGGETGFDLLGLDGLWSRAAVMESMPNHPFFFGGGTGAGGSSARCLSASATAAFRSSSSCAGRGTHFTLNEFGSMIENIG
jgi:hypothetical protein